MEMHSAALCRNDNPTVRKRVQDLRRVKDAEQLKVVIVSPWIQGYDTHWCGTHTEPCTKKKGTCQLCDDHVTYKWIGFLDCYQLATKKRFFLEFTDHAWEDLKATKGETSTFRGLTYVFFRRSGKMNSAVGCLRITEEGLENSRLPQAKNVEDSLAVAWKGFIRSGSVDGQPIE